MKLSKFYVFVVFLACAPLSPQANVRDMDYNDLHKAYVDNDLDAAEAKSHFQRHRVPMKQFSRPILKPNGLWGSIGVTKSLLTWEEVSKHLSVELEKSFDIFILVNTAEKSKANPSFPIGQHIRFVVRKNRATGPNLGDQIFIRDRNNAIVGIIEDRIDNIPGLPERVKTSTGLPGFGIRTFSGIFKVNYQRSKKFWDRTDEADGMSFTTYIDHVYEGGRESGVAIHGTPLANQKYLGNRRASHGCMRVLPQHADIIRSFLFQDPMLTRGLPKFERTSFLPSIDVQILQSGLDPQLGVKALFLIFEGFSNEAEDS